MSVVEGLLSGATVSDFIQSLVVIAVYRGATVLAGFVCMYMGYKLFVLGVYEKAGDLKAAWGEKRLVLKQAAPGTFFALFGAVIISLAVWRGLGVTYQGPSQSSVTVAQEIASGLLRGVQGPMEKVRDGKDLTDDDRTSVEAILAADANAMPGYLDHATRDFLARVATDASVATDRTIAGALLLGRDSFWGTSYYQAYEIPPAPPVTKEGDIF